MVSEAAANAKGGQATSMVENIKKGRQKTFKTRNIEHTSRDDDDTTCVHHNKHAAVSRLHLCAPCTPPHRGVDCTLIGPCAAPVLLRRRSTAWGTQWASRKRTGRRRALSTGRRPGTKSNPAPPTTTRCCRQILPSSRAAPAQSACRLCRSHPAFHFPMFSAVCIAPAFHFPMFSAVCICLALLHPRESPDKAHPSSPKIDVIGRHRIYCVNRQAPSPLLQYHGSLLHASTKTLSHVPAAKPIHPIFPCLWNVAYSVRAQNPIQKAVLCRGQAAWSDKTTHTHTFTFTHTHTHTHTLSAGKHFAKYTNHAVQSGFCPHLPNEIAEEPEDGV